MSFDDVLELNATDEAKWLHGLKSAGSHTAGYFVIGRKTPGLQQVSGSKNRWQQKAYPLSSIETIMGKLIPSMGEMPGDTYITQSTFATPNRKTASFNRVQSAWVDLDYYSDSYTPEQWAVIKLQKIQAHITSLGLPDPSLIIDSGRGAYVKWVFQSPTHDLPAWNMMQEALTVLFTPLKSDAFARDACRVLRCLKSVNSKNEKPVNVIAGSGKEYDFRVFAKLVADIYASDIGPHVIKGTSARSKRQAIAGQTIVQALERAAKGGDLGALDMFSKMHEPIMLENLSCHSLNWSRFADLRDLVLMRGGFEVGQRNNMLLWMVNSLAQAKVINTANWDDEVDNLIAAFPVGADFNPTESGYLNTVHTRLVAEERARANNIQPKPASRLYRPSNKYLIGQFKITENEQASLRTIISHDVKNDRRTAKRDQKAPGRSQRRESREAWHARVNEILLSKLSAEKCSAYSVEALPTPAALGIRIISLAEELGIERTVLSKFLKAKISDFFHPKDEFKTKAKSKKHVAAIETIHREDPMPVDEAVIDRVDEACVVIIEIQAKQKKMIEQVVEKERAQGQKRLGSAIDKIRARADREAVKDEKSSVPAAPTPAPAAEAGHADDMNWAKEKVTQMTSDSSNSSQGSSGDATPGSSAASPPRLVLKAGMFAQGQKTESIRPPQPVVPSTEKGSGLPASMPKLLPKADDVSVGVTQCRVQNAPTRAAVSDTDTQFFVGKRAKPRKFPLPCSWSGSSALPLNTHFEQSAWTAAAADGRFFVVEVSGGEAFSGLVRIINPEHPESMGVQAGKDLYGDILQLPVDGGRSLATAKTLNGCVLIAEKNRSHAAMPEALEEDMCVFFGQAFYLSRPPADYISMSQPFSSRPQSVASKPLLRVLAPLSARPELQNLPSMDEALAQEQDEAVDGLYAQDGLEPAP